MRFVVDECTGPAVANWLATNGHDVYSFYDQNSGSSDDTVLALALSENRILITNDKDFGEMIFREQKPHKGVIFLRLADERSANKIAVLQDVLRNYLDKLENRFVTVTESKIRIS